MSRVVVNSEKVVDLLPKLKGATGTHSAGLSLLHTSSVSHCAGYSREDYYSNMHSPVGLTSHTLALLLRSIYVAVRSYSVRDGRGLIVRCLEL
jgi:hypothetical protein